MKVRVHLKKEINIPKVNASVFHSLVGYLFFVAII
jgi:hypothetical protein